MKLKKYPKADLENKRGLFIEIGFTVVLSIILIAFEWSTVEKSDNVLGELGDLVVEEEIIPITRQQETPPPPPPPQQVSEELLIVEDDKEIEEELEIKNTESDENVKIEIVEVEAEEEEEEVFMFAIIEDKPEYPGGMAALFKFLQTNIKYPQIAKENDIQGTVYVQFVISKDGKVTNVELARGVDPLLDKEALRVVEAMPSWSPGKQRGKPVKVGYTLPVKFKLY